MQNYISNYIRKSDHPKIKIMPREFQFQVSPEVAANENLLAQHVAKLFQVSPKEIQKVEVLKRSIDARQKAIKINIKAIGTKNRLII